MSIRAFARPGDIDPGSGGGGGGDDEPPPERPIPGDDDPNPAPPADPGGENQPSPPDPPDPSGPSPEPEGSPDYPPWVPPDSEPVAIIYEVWLTEADGRVCPTCGPLHGAEWQAGYGPYPPAHYGCRCVRVYSQTRWITRKRPGGARRDDPDPRGPDGKIPVASDPGDDGGEWGPLIPNNDPFAWDPEGGGTRRM